MTVKALELSICCTTHNAVGLVNNTTSAAGPTRRRLAALVVATTKQSVGV